MEKELLVVGLDHTPAGNAALQWAVKHAADRGARLLTVHVSDRGSRADLALERDVLGEHSRAAIRLHDQVIRHVGTADDTVPTTVSMIEGGLVDRLVKASEHAAALVIGSPQSADHAHLPAALAERLACPVMVVDSEGAASEVPCPILTGTQQGRES